MRRLLILFLFSCGIIFSQNNASEWQTFFEKSNYLNSADYNGSIEYMYKLESESKYLKNFIAGKTPQGRDFIYTVVSKDGVFSPEFITQSSKPLIFIENGIHSGEIEGKDACFLLLREMLITGEKTGLLDNFNFVIIPIFNIDGHERRSPYNRINQNGPTVMGWRTTAQNYNLNRDFLKADAPEMQMLLKIFTMYEPDFFIDTHTTNGADYQYTVTYATEKYENVPPPISEWINNTYIPELEKRVNETGYLIGPYIGFVKGDIKNGAYDWSALPRFSNGYAAVKNRPGLLIETHMLKPYKDRVFSTKAVIETTLDLILEIPGGIKKMNKKADEFVIKNYLEDKNPFPLSLKRNSDYDSLLYRGIEYDMVFSEVAGDSVKFYNGKAFDEVIPFYNHLVPNRTITAPEAYYIPAEFSYLGERLKFHGIKYKVLTEDVKVNKGVYRFGNVKFASSPYESHIQPEFDHTKSTADGTIKAGGILVSTNQKNLPVILHLLEPDGPDSFLSWGFFNMIFERKEYFEFYSMEPIASKMYEENPDLRKEFDEKVKSDSSFAADSYKRLNFFYERSPYYDKAYKVYPVVRVEKFLND